MKTKFINKTDASAKELRDFAKTALGLDIPDNANSAKVLTALAEAGYTGDQIAVFEVTETRASGGSIGTYEKDEAWTDADGVTHDKREYACIKIAESPERGGDRPVFLSVNGKGIYVPRKEPAEVPYIYVQVLDAAKTRVWDNETNGLQNHHDVPRYNYQMLPRPE